MQYINKDKLRKIKLNKNNFYVAIDFDKTITAAKSCDSWDASGNILGEEFRKKSYELHKKYGPIELDYTISFEEKKNAMEEWYYESFKSYYTYGLTKEKLKESINNSNLIFRSGAKEFLYNMYKNNIPVIILSAGIGNVIEQFLQKNNCYYNNMNIISNFISFDKDGNIEKHKGELIHTLNKTMDGHITEEFSEKIKDRAYRLLFGDVIEDKNMVPIEEEDRTISIRIFRKEYRRKPYCF